MSLPTTEHPAPVDDASRARRAALAALRDAVDRSTLLWRHVGDPGGRVPGLMWTSAETAAHVVGDLRDYTDALIRRTNGDSGDVEAPSGSPSRLSAVRNGQHLAMVQERDLRRLADMLEVQAAHYLAVARDAIDTWAVATPNGLVLNPPTMTRLLLGEQVLHGLDIARAGHVPWSISRSDAVLVIRGVLAVAPRYVHPSRSANLRASYEIRIRGGGRYRLTVHDGTAHIAAAGEKADCIIIADPIAFLLLGYGRIPRWAPIIRGQLLAAGRKPWLAAQFATILTRP